MKKDYYLGLDIGINSVGWAVTDTEYNLCKFKGKDMWGIRLFESADTAEERRIKRTNRRRLKRRHERLVLLQGIFAEEICKVDPSFFVRMNESKLQKEDKTIAVKHPLFNDPDYTDIDFYRQYPTMYHLRAELIRNNDYHDPRLVYLALHHIIKYRGHFLIDGGLETARSFEAVFARFIETLQESMITGIDVLNSDEFRKALADSSIAKSEKQKRLEALFRYDEEDLEKDEKKRIVSIIKELCKLVSGNQGDISKIFKFDFSEDDIPNKFNFSDGKYDEEIEDKLTELYPEKAYLLGTVKALFDWGVLVNIGYFI